VSPPAPNHLAEILSLLAHDLRNPLSALLTNVNFVKSVVKDRSPEVDEALSDSALSCAMLGQFIGNLDVLSRAFDEGPVLRRPTAARQAVNESVVRLAAQARLNEVEVEVAAGQHAPQVFVDPGFFGRALDNLLANSLQYSPAKSTVNIECVVREDRGYVILSDDGPTVPVAIRDVVVTAEGQSMAKQRFEARYGRGLGLYCAAEAARIAGAEIGLADHAGRSRLELSAPLAS
jgi:K+-sensing histidine kinase KdpD